jgi:DNA-binding LacI/PurR family transcriptional regulator
VNRTVKLADVAKVAGVSLGTASNAFNRPHLVRKEVRELVEATARKLGYSGPDPKGRLLMGGKTNAIGVLLPGQLPVAHTLQNVYLQAFMQGVAEVCDENGANLLIVSGAEDRKISAIRTALVDGFIISHGEELELMSLRQRKVPFVVTDMDAGPGVSSVRIDARLGARMAAQHLLALGHRRFVILSTLRKQSDPIWHPPGQANRQLAAGLPLDHEKLLGYRDALEAAGLSINAVPIVESFLRLPWAAAGADAIFERAPEATAILAMTDTQALILLSVARQRGIRIPDDVSVIGFDDRPDAASADPPLTTIAQPIVEKGRVAASMLFSHGPPLHIILPVSLVVRLSTAHPRFGRSA